MGIFDKFKTSTAIDRLSEEKLYEQVAQELKAGKKREGIWVKAMAKSGGVYAGLDDGRKAYDAKDFYASSIGKL